MAKGGYLAGLGGLLMLSACSSGEGYPLAATDAESLDCALNGASDFAADCAVERSRHGEVLLLTVRHPDGGFRRFEVLNDGHGLAMADGAATARTTLSGEMLELAVEADRYRFPVTLAKLDAQP